MLKKLLKYDLCAVGRYWWIAMLTMSVMSFGAAISLRIYNEISLIQDFTDVHLMLQIFSYISFMLCAIAIGICMTAVAILIYVRYFKHLFTDEGYLTFTLPVSRKQIFLSKTISAVSWVCLSDIILFVCIILIGLVSMQTVDNSILAFDKYEIFLKSVVDDISEFGLWRIVQFVASMLISLSSVVLSISVGYFCITLGATVVKKAKIVAAIGVYYLLNMIYSSVFMTLGVAALIFMGFGLVDFLTSATPNMFNAVITLGMLVAFAVISTFAALFWCVTQNILERKLNLA